MHSLLRPPVFVDETRTRNARQVWIVVWTLMLAVTVFTPVFWWVIPENRERWFWLFTVVTGVGFGVLAIAQRGAVQTASVALLLGLWALLTVFALTGGGIRGPASVDFLLLIVMASLLLGLRAGLTTTFLCGLTGLGLVVASTRGLLPVSMVHHTDFTYWLSLVLCGVVLMGFQYLATSTITHSLKRAQDELDRRLNMEREREALLHDLGERVKELTALHSLARLLESSPRVDEALLGQVIALLPRAWQYPEVCAGRIRYADLTAATPGWRETIWMQSAGFATSDHRSGSIEIAYLEARPAQTEGPFLTEERALIESIAEMLGHYIERRRVEDKRRESEERLFRSHQQLRALTGRLQSLREEERKHIAREVHDHLGQLLTALRLDLHAVTRRIPALGLSEAAGAIQSKVESAIQLTQETIVSVQKIAAELRPDILDRLGLADAIEAEIHTFQSRTPIIVEYRRPAGMPPIPAEHATAIFRVFQEILTNIARHSQARRVVVNLAADNGRLVLEAGDDGVGLKPTDLEDSLSLGLLGMRERAAQLGGTVSFDSPEGLGTRVKIELPLMSAGSGAP